MSATAVNGGHVNRALDFYNAAGKYFVIGGTTAWGTGGTGGDENNPPTPALTDFKLNGVIGYRKVEATHMVIQVEDSATVGGDVFEYQGKKYKKIPSAISAKTDGIISKNATSIKVKNLSPDNGLYAGAKIRIHNLYEAKIESISGNELTLDTAAPSNIPDSSYVIGGALVEGAKSVYVTCTIGSSFPIADYRQIGFCTGVTYSTGNGEILRAADYAAGKADEWNYPGVLEVLDNRVKVSRNLDQTEQFSLLIEF